MDGLLALAVLVTGVAEVWVPFESRTGTGDPGWSTLQVLVMAGALLLRRGRPLVATVLTCVAMAGFHAADVAYLLFNGQFVPLALVTFAVARHGRGRVPVVGGGLVAATLVHADLTIAEMGDPSEIIFHWGVLGLTYAVGTWQRVTERRAEEAQRRVVAVEVEAAGRAAAARAEERTRIARELHDVVAHSMSLMVVQAGAAEGVVGTPEEVRRSLESIRRTGSEALAEMRRLVTMLRDPDEGVWLAPQPGLAALEGLVESARDGGLPVSLDVVGQVRDLPAGLDLAAFRIVQEALTNARRHAGPTTRVAVVVRFTAEDLSLAIRDDGSAVPVGTGSGHGLVGMRERVQLYGGRLQAGALAGGGFAVEASLPLTGARPLESA